MYTARTRKRSGNLENTTLEAKLVPGVEHARAELKAVVGESIELER
jgi:hypothetical protein